ncbi:trans-sulfuration enzyme family protein [Bacillus sp. NSP9.1]|uniref:trans-sulfuration enzyme family protein n=1 Tax=Bacillus sp. NSP9.1 TaxID=1071078 RepID=UPI00041BB742|nr:aminotransferase class I/II-fold pyridoxal phosphate-dependent enzyme [Bacillus sp. NSP9.1]QHZ47128.1 aminotransferase class I/II-fold pyridoxal phosphate-dependent enzyme [Bacillus sp. NSP9.1]
MDWHDHSILVHGRTAHMKKNGPVANSIVPAVAFSFLDAEQAACTVAGRLEGTYYGRYGNPTTQRLERKIADLERGEEALGVSSGMAAISTALLAFLKHHGHVVCTKDVYGGSHKFLTTLAPRFGINVSFVDCTDLDAVEAAILPETKVLYLESPSNPCLTVLDIEGLSKLAHIHGLKVIVDNTFMTPYLQRPLRLGADIVVHSATKYLNGHGDVIAGFIVGDADSIRYMRKHIVGDLGQVQSAWDSFLIERGMKTLGLRMNQHCNTAMEVAGFLEGHPKIAKVYYPGLASHPQHQLAKRQMRNMGGIVSFEVQGGYDAAKKFIDSLQMIMISFSLGDPETLVQHPASMTHFSIPRVQRMNCGITDGLIRLSIGLEDDVDILKDLEQALIYV